MAKKDLLRPWEHAALTGQLRLRLVLALAAVAAAAGVLLLLAGGTGRPQAPTYGTDFVALGAGPRDARAALVRQPAKGVKVALGGSGYSVAREQAEVRIALANATGSWRRHANGVSRALPFGRETIVVDRGRTEQFLTVERPQGKRTWRWRLDTSLKPESRVDGSIALVGPNGPAALRIAPVAIRDLAGREITPDGLDWKLDRDERGWLLSLDLDDEGLPLPYVIDPAVDYPSPLYLSSTASTITNSWRLVGTSPTPQNIVTDTVPAQNATGYYQFRPGLSTNAAGTPSATPTGRGWALDTAGGTGFPAGSWDFTIQVDIPNTTFTAGSAHLVVGVWKGTISGGTFTSTGVLLDPSAAGAEGSSELRPGSTNTVTVTDSFSLPQFSLAANERLYVELWRRQIGGINTGTTTRRQLDLLVNNGTARIVHPAADDAAPTGSLTSPGAVIRATATATASAADTGSGVASVLFEGAPAGSGTWTPVAPADTSPPYSVSFDTTVAPDGLYDIRATMTDNAGNSSTTTTVTRVDNSSPDQNPLTLTPLTGTANQYWDSTNSVLYYNSTSAGTFSLSSVPRDVSPPISFVGGNGGANNNSPLTLNVPAGVQLGDLLIAQVGYERTMAISVPTPAGWTRYVDRDNGTIYGQVIFYRWATASEPASYTIPHASGAASISGTLLAYRGVASVSPVLVNNGTVATGATLTAPSVTTTAGCGRLLAFYGVWNTATLSTPAGMTQRATAINTEVDWNSRVLAADEILGAAGATGTRVSTATVTDANNTGPGSNVSELVALRPPACVSSVQYPTPGQTGFTGGGNTDTVEPYAASPDYSFGPTNTVSPGARTIVISDEAGNPALNQTITFTRDVAAPVTTDDTGTITNAWRNVDTTVTLSPTDGTGAGLVQTYYTTNGVNPTTGSPTGTSILLTAEGTYTIKYFSTDRVANTEAVKTGAAQIRIDKTNPTSATLSALPAAIRNGQSLTGGGADALSGVGSITYLYCAGAACTPSTVVGSSSIPAGGYPVTWNSQPADGTYRVRARVFDAAGNQLDSAIQTVTIDNTNPTGAVTAPAAAANVRGTSVSVTSDSADGGSGVANALFQRSPAGAGTWTTIGAADTSSPYGVTWDTTAVTDGLYDLRVITTDNAGNTFTSTTIANVRVDNTNPTGAVTAPAAAANVRGTSVSVTANSADGGSGVANALFQRSPAGAGTWTTIGAADTSSPYGVTWDTTAVTDGLYDLRVITTDNAGNTFTSTTIANVRVDNTVPTQSLALTGVAPAGSAYLSGTNLFYRGAAAGQLRIRNTVADGGSGPASSTTSPLGGTSTGWTHTAGTISTPAGGPYDSNLFSWSAGTTSSPTVDVNATDAAGNNSATATLTLRNDTTAPAGGALTVNGVAASAGGTTSNSNGSFTIGVRTDWTETATPTASGLASSTLTRDSASYNNNACGAYSGSPTTIVGAPAQNLTVGCYRYVLTGTDNVGNVVSIQTDVLVHGAATQIALTGSTANLTSGATRVLTATVRDANGNTVVSDSSTVITFAKQSGAGTVTGTGTATAASGVATKTITGQLVGSVTMEATAAGLTTGTLGAFTVVHGAAASIALTGSTANLTSGATRVLTATIQDAAGNTVTADNTTVVTFAKQSGAGTVTGTGTATAASGVATKTITGALVGPVVMEATAAGLTTGTLGSFTVVHGTAAQIALSGSTTNLTSGTTRVLTATIQDAAGNTVTADNTTVVTFAKQSGAGTVTGTGTSTAAAGVATKTITGALVGPVVMQATAVGLTTGTLGSFTVVHGAAADIALTGSTTNLTSGTTRVLTATLRDAAGNTVTSDNTTVITFAKQSGAGTVTGTGTATAASGVATKTITGALVGPVVMEATALGLTTGTLGSFTVVHGAATQIALSGATTNLVSGATRVLTATIQDAAGNTVTADNTTVVTFGKQSGAGTVTGTGTATAASGVATKTITGTLVGPVVMEATAAGLTTGTLGSFTVVQGAAAQIALSGATTNLTSGATRVLTATIQDAAGNTVTADNTTVVTFGKQSGAGTVTGTGTATAASGVATKTITGQLVGSVTMEATAAGLTTGTLASFTVVHGAAAQIALSGATTNLTSGATRVLTATIQDAAGNTVTADNTTVVTFAKQSGTGTVTGTGTATAASGVATKTITGALVGSVTMEATAAGLTTGTLGSFTVVHGAAAQIALTGSTTNLTSGATRVLTATIQDAAGNTVTADNTTVVTFAKQSGAGTVTGTGTATAASGVATKTITGQLVGSVTMEATAAGLTTGTLGSFTVVHGAAAQIALSGATTNLVSGATRVLTATIQDAAGNTVTADNTTVVTFAKQSGAGTVTGTGTATAASGVATKTITGVLVGSVTMEATAAGLTTGTLGTFTVVHGAAADIVLSGSTANLASGATRVLTATLRDAAGNTVTADNTTVITFAKQSGAGTVTGTGTATAASGVATKTVTGQLVGSVTMEATAAGLTTGTLGAFTVVHGAAASIALTGSTANLTSGATRVLTATIQDAAGNTVTADNTTVVTFAKQSGAGTVTGTGTATAASGVATKTITGQLVGSVTMEATAAGLTTGTLGAFTVVHGAAASIALTGSTANLTSGATRVLTATIQDAAGNTVTADNTTVVTFAKQSGAGTVTGTGTATATAGVATKTITGQLVGSVTMEATAAGLTTGTLGAFTVVHGGAAQIALTGSTANLTSGATRVLTATIQDAAGNTVTADNTTVVTFAKQSGAGTVTGTGTATAASGVATKTITGVLVGSVTMEATAAGLTTGTLGAFTVVHGAAAQIALSGATTNLVSGATRVLTATILDASGNTVTGDSTTVVTFGKQSGAGTVTGTGTATAASGVATKTVTGQLVGSVTMEATAAGLTTGSLGAFTVVHGPAADIVLTGATTNLTSGATRVLTATIKDAAGNTVTSDNSTVITFAKQSGAGTVTGTGTATATAGVATKTITGALVGPVTMEATALGLTTGTLAPFTVVHGAAAQIALGGATTNLVSGATRVLTATIQDAAGNTVTADNTTVVTFGKQSGAGTITGTGTATAASGVATKTITGQLVGSVTMEATAAGLATGTLGAFTVVHGAAADIVLSGATTNLASGATRVLTATIQDAAGNTVTADNTTVVAFAKASGAGTVTGTGNATATAGVATKTITGALVGSVTMEATAIGLTTGTLGAFTVVHGAAADIALTGSTANLTSGATRLLTATIRDAAGNTVTGDSSTVITFAKASGAGTVTGTGTATAAAGVATKTITGALVGSVTMEATALGLTTGTLAPFTVVHGAAAQIALTGATTNLVSGATRVLTATIQDAAGNTVTSDNSTVIAFAKQSGAGSVTGSGNGTTIAGVATRTVTGGLVGSVTMEATAAGVTTGTLGSFTVVHGAAAQIALTGATTNLVSGATRVLTATIQDAAGNTVTSDNTTVITFAKQSGAGAVTGAGTATAASGVATKTITGQLVGSVTMEATAAGLTTGTLGSFTVVHGAAAQIALSGATTNLVSGATRVLTATIKDAAGNTVTGDNTTVITFAKQAGAGTVSGTGNATAIAGVATKTVTGQLVGPVTMEATAAGLTTGTLAPFTVVHGAAADIVLTGATTNLVSGATRVLTATIRDAAGNTVTGDNSTVISFAQASGAGTVSGTGNATATAGVATKTITGQLVGPVTMEATAAGLTTGSLGAFTVVHGAAADISLSGSTANLSSGSTRVLTATIRDAAGNTVTSDNSTVVSFGQQSGAGTVTGSGNTSVTAGVATKTITGQLVGSVTMEASAAGLTTGSLAPFTVVHGAAAQIALSGATTNLTSGATRVLTATIQDAAGNTVSSDNSTVVTFGKQSGTGTVAGAGTATAIAGIATKTITGAVVGSVTMEATAAGVTTGTLGAFTVVHGAAAEIVLTGATTNLVSGATRVLTATIRDAAGNTVTGDNSTVISFAQASGAGTVTGTGTATATAGVATKTITGALVGSVTMEATAAGLTTGSLGAFTVVHGAAIDIALTGSTTNLTSGATRVLTATLRDAAGNTVTSDNTTVLAFAKQSGAGTVSGTGNATATAGVATKTITGQLVGPVTMEATAAGLTTGTLSAFNVVHGSAADIIVTGSTANLPSGATRVLTATIRDAAGNTVTADNTTVVTFGKQSGTGTVAGTGTATATSGVATKTITGALVGSVTMEATAAGVTTGTLGAFTVVHGAAADIVLTGATTNLTSGATRVLTATIQDAAGNTVTGDNTTLVTFAKASGAGTVTGTGTATATNGVATKTVTGALVGSVNMEATATGLTTGSLGAFTVVHGAAVQVALSGATSDLTSGAARLLTATVQDAAGNTVTSDNSTSVSLAQASGAGTVTGLAGAEVVAGGIATKTVTGDLAGSVDLEATASGLTTGTLSFDVVHGAAYKVTVSASPADLVSGTTRVITATVRDAAGNRVASDNSTVVTFSKASGAGTVTGLGTDTATAGVASKTVTGQLAGTITILGSASGLVADNVSFDIVHGSAATIDLSGSTANLASGATRVLTATIKDAAGNTVTSDNATVLTFAKQSGAGTVTGTGTATATAGVATRTITGQLVGPVTMEATAAGLTTGTLAPFTVVHGAASQIALTGATTNLVSGATRVLTATLQDAAGNTVTSDNATVLTFAKQSGAGTVTGTGTATATAGVATKTITGQLVGPVTMEATAAGLTTGTLAPFSVVHGTASQIAFTHSGSTASGDNHTLTATIQDAAGNTVTSDSSTVVAFAKTGGPGTVTGLATATASNGVATRVVVNGASGQIDLDAQAAGLAVGSTSYVITAGSASTLTSTIAASPTSIVADGGTTSTITVRLKDAAGNDLNGTGGTVALALTGAGSLSAVTDNGDGTYTATLTSPTTVGGATVTGTLNGSALAATAGVTYVHGPATEIVLTESGSTVAGNGHTLTATIQDAHGNTVTSDNSTVVAFAKTGGPGTVAGLGNATATSGVATKNVTNKLAGQIDLDAHVVGLTTGATSYTIVTGPVSAADSTVVAVPAAVYANGSDTATITVTLRDAGGNGIAGKTVTLAQGAGGSTIAGGGATNASGVVTFSASDSTVETVTYAATDTTDSIALMDDATVNFTFSDSTPPTNTITLDTANRALLTGTTLYYNGAAGGSFTLSSAVADGGAGPLSAAYPAVAQAGWTHGAQTVSTPAGGPYLSSAFTFGAGTSGDFTYGVTANDAWTPTNSSVTTLNVTEDSTAPSASILCNATACAGGWYTASPVAVTLAAPDAGAGLDQIRYTIDGTDPTIFTGNVYAGGFTVAAEGVTTVKYRAFDRIGNDSGVLAQTVRIDTIAPDTTLDSTPTAATQDTTPTFAFSSPEPGTTFQMRLNGGSWTSATSPLTLGPLAENTYTLDVRATDVAGNVDGSPASFIFTVDTTAANTTITSSPPADSSSTSASFSFIASDAGPGFECRLDGGAFADCSSPVSYTGLTEAAHTFEVRAEDAAGNLDATPATHGWTIDLTAPNTSFLSTPAHPSSDPTPTFALGSTESPAAFECDLDGGGWTPCATPFTTPTLADGSHTLRARASDAAGNTDASEVTYTWLVDATDPTGSITSPVDGADVSGTIILVSNSTDGGSGVATVVFQRSPAGAGVWTNQSASWDTTAQADGDYDVRAITTDAAGNSVTSPLITVTVDNTHPTLTVSAPNPVNLSTPDPASITATASDTGTGIAFLNFEQCSETSPTCTSDTWTPLGIDTTAPYGVAWPIPSDGTRLLRVRAEDEAGLQAAELVLVTVDRTRPAGSLTAPASGADLRGANVGLTATASDAAPGTVNTVTFQRSPAGAGTWSDVAVDSSAPYTANFDTTAVADGLYDLRVFTTDTAGNAESTPATIQVRVDNTDPTGMITAPVDAADLRGTVALTSNSADAGSGVATVVFQRSPAGAGTWTSQAASWNTTLQADGLYDLRVVTTDNAGNAFSSAPITVRVDNTAPTGTVTAPVGGADVRGTIALASTSADAGSGVATTQFQRSPAGAGTWTNQAASWNTTLQADGLYDLHVVTTDNAGNSFTSGAITVRVDNTAPTGSITAPANGAEVGVSPVALTSNSADAGSGVATVVFERSPAGAGSWSATPASWDTASGPDAVADGDYDLHVRTTDNAGNSFTSAVITVKVDHTAPTTSASVAPGSPSNSPITVTFSASDGTGSGVSATSYSIDGGSVQLGNSAIVAAPGDHSNDGSHVVQYFSTDDVGNVETPKTVTVVIDTTAPSGAPGDPGTFLRGIANLSYSTGSGDVSSVQFQFSPAGAGAWSNIGAADISPPYDAAWNTVLVADGPYDLRAVVTDTTGNVANELLPGLPKTVDNTAPSGSVTSPAAASFVSGTVNVTASASDGAAPPASGVSAVRFELKPSGSGSFSVFGTQNAPVAGSTYQQSLLTSGFPDGPADLRVVVTDVAGNETTSAATTVTFDNDAPVITLNDPGAAVSGTITLGVTTSADTAQVVFERSPAGSGAWTTIATDSTPGDGFTAAFDTSALADGLYDLRARATDVGGNPGTSGTRTTRLDNTQPTGAISAPTAGAIVGGPAVQLTAAAADGGSGVVSVAFEVKAFGASSFTPVGSDTTAPYTATWDSTTAPDGDAEIRAIVTDAAGNVHMTAVVIVTVDSTGPAVTLADPGAVLFGTVGLTASTSGGATRVSFGVSPAGSGTWTEIANDTSSPFAADLDTSALADGLYDLRAIGYDSLGNASTASVRASVRFDNTAPNLVSADPADGSVSTSANQILLTGSEPVTAPGALLDGVAAPAPSVSGNELTFATGSLAEGLHVLSGELVDASGNRTPFRVAITIESTPQADRPPVEKSASPTATTTLEAAGQLATVQLPASAWPAIPGPKDFLVLHVDPILPSAGLASRLAAGSNVIEVTARWALAGTNVHDFDDVLEVLLPAAAGTNGAPVTSQDATTWRTLASVNGTTLPIGRADGYYRDSAGVHVLTRHLSYFAFFGDDEPPTPPRDVAGVVAEDGLTLRWLPGTDDSGQLGKVVLLVNGEPYATFDPTQYEVKLGAFAAGDTRVFSFLQYDAAGNVSEPSQALRAVPSVVGLGADAAAARLAAAGFALGKIERTVDSTVAPGTVVGPTKLLVAAIGSSIDVVAAAGSPQTQFVFRIANDKVVKVKVGKPASIPVRVLSTRPASGSAMLATATGRRLYTWRFQVKSGATITKLRLPSQVRRPGYYRLIWSAHSGNASARKAVRIRFVGPALEQLRTRPHRVEVVLAVDTSRGAHTISSSADRVVSHATPERTFALLSAADRSVSVVVVDVDRFGIRFLRDVRTVFPTVRAIALSDRRVRWPAIKRAGAFSVLPRSATHEQLGRTIAVAGGR